jgi:hypothetical protein
MPKGWHRGQKPRRPLLPPKRRKYGNALAQKGGATCTSFGRNLRGLYERLTAEQGSFAASCGETSGWMSHRAAPSFTSVTGHHSGWDR